MSAARSFRSVFMVASCAGAALGCYLVSLRVASERAALEDVETKIVLAQRDIRLLQTEIGTRGRLAQLERWNVKVLALSAPSADQFLEGGFQLARLGRPDPTPAVDAPVVLASAPAPHPQPAPLEEGEPSVVGAGANRGTSAAQLMREASLKIAVREEVAPVVRQEVRKPTAVAAPKPLARKTVEPVKAVEKKPKAVTRPAETKSAAKAPAKVAKAAETKAVPAPKKAGDKKVEAAAKPVTKPVRLAKVDPLAPLPAKANPKKTAKDSGSAR
jgi:hypothetical protein